MDKPLSHVKNAISSAILSLKAELQFRQQLLAEHEKIVAAFTPSGSNSPKMKGDILTLNQLINTLQMSVHLLDLLITSTTPKMPTETTLSDAQLIEKCESLITKLIESSGKSWELRVPADPNHCPDFLLPELLLRFKNTIENESNNS